MAIEDALREHLADLTDPVIHLDFGAAQAQRRFAAHRDAVCALTTTETPIGDRAQPVGIPAPEHLGHQVIIVGRLVARMGVRKRLPMIGKDLLKDTPVPGGCCKHPRPPNEGGWDGDGAAVVPRLLRAVHSSSTMAITAYRSNTKNENS